MPSNALSFCPPYPRFKVSVIQNTNTRQNPLSIAQFLRNVQPLWCWNSMFQYTSPLSLSIDDQSGHRIPLPFYIGSGPVTIITPLSCLTQSSQALKTITNNSPGCSIPSKNHLSTLSACSHPTSTNSTISCFQIKQDSNIAFDVVLVGNCKVQL